MTTTGAQRRQARPAHGHELPVDAGDDPWTVSVTQKPHDPPSYTLHVQSPTRHLTLSRSAREIVELHSQLRDAYPGVPHPAFPLDSAASIVQRPRLASRASKSTGIRNYSRPSVTTNPTTNRRSPVEEPTSTDTAHVALAWYLTALSNDPVFRQVPPWKNFVRVRTDDHESVSIEGAIGQTSPDVYSSMPSSSSITTDMQRLSVLVRAMPHGIVHGPRGNAPPKDVSSVRVTDFEMVCVLGIGSTGKVLLARPTGRSGVYALKVIAKRRVLAYQEPQRALTEQAVLRRMASEGTNSFVAKLLLSFHDEDNLYMALKFYPCGDLRTQLDRCKRFGHDLCRFYAAELVEALKSLHAAGIIHRNLKPEHILVDKNGHIVLCGFGKCRDFRSGATQADPLESMPTRGFPDGMNDAEMTTSLCGTAEYFAPEVIKGSPYGYAVDWWSLGTILYEMLTGNRPFDADNMLDMYDRILHDNLRFPDDPTIDNPTRNFIQRLLERDPKLRLAEPQIKRHHYFVLIDWSDVHYRQLRPPYIPPIDRSNPADTQNFEDVYLKMRPVISDEFDAYTEQEWGQTDLESIDNVDPVATPSHPRVTPAHPREEDSFRGQYSDDIGDEESVSVTEEPGEDSEVLTGTVPGRDIQVPTENGILEAQSVALRLPVSSPLIQQRPGFPKPEPPSLQVDANASASPSNGPLSVTPHITSQALAPPTLPTTETVLASAAATAVTAEFPRHLKVPTKHKAMSHRLLPNVKRTRNEKPGVSTIGNHLPTGDDGDDGDSDVILSSEGIDNGPPRRDLVRVASGNSNGPSSTKSMSKRSFSTTWSVTSTARSRSPPER